MRSRSIICGTVLAWTVLLMPGPTVAQGTLDDYRRAATVRQSLEGLTVGVAEAPTWIDGTTRFWYRRSVTGGNDFVLVDAVTQQKQPAFDHASLASGLSQAVGQEYSALTLPFRTFEYVMDGQAIEANVGGVRWRCSLSDFACDSIGEVRGGGFGGGGITGGSAGGQNSTGGVLFHGDFYKVAVSRAGCHDNRMDKIWWNEHWMGWPLGPHYEASSNAVSRWSTRPTSWSRRRASSNTRTRRRPTCGGSRHRANQATRVTVTSPDPAVPFTGTANMAVTSSATSSDVMASSPRNTR